MECLECNTKFPSQAALNVHNKMHKVHFKTKRDSFHCTKSCGRIFSSLNSLNAHMKTCTDPEHDFVSNESVASVEVSVNREMSQNSEVDVEQPRLESIENNTVSLESEINSFVAKLYANPNLPRSHVQWLVDNVKSLLDKGLTSIENAVSKSLVDTGGSQEQQEHISSMFSSFKGSFDHLSTEYKRLKFFAASGQYVPPESYEIGVVDGPEHSASGSSLQKQKVYGQKVPLDKVLKLFLELPDCFSSIMAYMTYLENLTNIENYLQCPHWKKARSKLESKLGSKLKPTDIVLPLFLFYDDFQCNNVLGSHAEKLGGVYISLPSLPPECQSAIENIILALIFKTSYRNKYGDKKVFAPLIEMLTSLQNDGIYIQTDDGIKHVYFITPLLLGDNLGVNSLGGFVECFTANYFCRFCKTKRCVTLTQTVEDCSTLRDEFTYDDDVKLNDYTSTGIKRKCELNVLPSFHIISNYCVDTFHDWMEGICHYTMLHVLDHCIPKYFDVDILNDRIALYDFGPCESNRVPLLSAEYSSKDKLKLSGSETLVFVKHFGLLIGDRVLVDDSYWKLYVKLRELLDVCLAKSFSPNTSNILRILVKEFNSMYFEVTRDTLKAKMHFLVHYPRVFSESGSFDLMSTKKYERKHRSLLGPAHSTTSRVNIEKTVAIKHQLHMCYRFMSKESIIPSTVSGPSVLFSLADLECYNNIICKTLPPSFEQSPQCLSLNWVQYKGTRYKPGMVLLVDVKHSSPVFGLIELVLSSESEISFLFSYLVTFGLDKHVVAYEVDSTNVYSTIHPDELYDPFPLHINRSTAGDKYVILKAEL